MTQVLNSQSHLPSSSPSSICCVPTPNNDSSSSALQSQISHDNNNYCDSCLDSLVVEEDRDKEEDQLSLLALLITAFRKSLVGCRTLRKEEEEEEKLGSMEIGWPTEVRHVAHVTFDRFNGFLGLPVEFEPEVPRRAPSASASVFGVSTESMQCSFDSRGNSVPTILLLMQRHLYAQGGLQAEGIFRINAENSQEEHLREQLNSGVVPDGIEVHCLAGLIKAWFRELPSGVLDPLSPEQVMQCHSEEQCTKLVRLLAPTEAALLDWAINLMADVVQEEHHNKMNARNVAMVFAPNMTQMADPLTALMYAVQVMNFLRTLIAKTLKERGVYVSEPTDTSNLDPSNDNGHHSQSQPCLEEAFLENKETDESVLADEPVVLKNPSCPVEEDSTAKTSGRCSLRTYMEKPISDGSLADASSSGEIPTQSDITKDCEETNISYDLKPLGFNPLALPNMNIGQSSNSNLWKGPSKISVQPMFRVAGPAEKSRGSSNIVSRINSRVERVEAWR